MAASFDVACTTLLPTVMDVDNVILPLKAVVTGRQGRELLPLSWLDKLTGADDTGWDCLFVLEKIIMKTE